MCLKPAPVCLVWFQWYLECGFIKTLDKHWTHPVSVCSALHFRGLCIVAATTLQIFVGTVKGQARVWDQVLKLTEAPLQHSVWGPSPIRDCFIELFLRHPPPFPPPLFCLPPFTPLKDPCLYYRFHTEATSQKKAVCCWCEQGNISYLEFVHNTAHDKRFTWSHTAWLCPVWANEIYNLKQTV